MNLKSRAFTLRNKSTLKENAKLIDSQFIPEEAKRHSTGNYNQKLDKE